MPRKRRRKRVEEVAAEAACKRAEVDVARKEAEVKLAAEKQAAKRVCANTLKNVELMKQHHRPKASGSRNKGK